MPHYHEAVCFGNRFLRNSSIHFHVRHVHDLELEVNLQSANSTDGNQRIDGRYLEFMRENFRIVSGLEQK
jgi:hypothetical protein